MSLESFNLYFKSFQIFLLLVSLKDLNPISSIEKWLEEKADLLFAPKAKRRKQSRVNSTSKFPAKLVTFANAQPATQGSFAMSPFQYSHFSPVYYSDELETSINGECGSKFW
jgi:hypothetical protein